MAKSGRAALSDAAARQIKELLIEGASITMLARSFYVSVETVGRIKRGLTYQHVRVEGEEQLRSELEYVPRGPLEANQIPVWDRAEDAEKRFLERMAEGGEAKPIVIADVVTAPVVKDTSPLTETELQVLGYFGRAAPGELVERARINGQLKGE